MHKINKSKCPVMIFLYMVLSILDSAESSGMKLLQVMNKFDPAMPRVELLDSFRHQKVNNDYNMTFSPDNIEEMYEDERVIVNFTLNCCSQSGQQLKIVPEDSDVAVISVNSTITIIPSVEGTFSSSFEVLGKRLGLTDLKFHLESENGESTEIFSDYQVIVLREERLVDDIYRNGIIVCASLIYLGFGCQIDLDWIWSILKKPVAPAIGVGCQFLVMPLLGFGVANLLRLDDEYAFGLLAMSCSPGGGGSNVYANLLRGDLDLSITMTCISTLLSLAFMPFWMFALGRFFIDEDRIEIPYGTIMRSLLTIVLPLVVGLAIRKFIPKVAKFLVKATKPISFFFILYMLTFGTYVNWYIFIIMGTVPEVIPAATLVPTFGFALGYLIAYLLKQGNKKSTTISVETGYQNASIPIIMLQGNFQQPEGDLGAVMPVATAFFMQIPMYIWYAVLEIRDRCCKNEVEDENIVKDVEDGERGVEISSSNVDEDQTPEVIAAYKEKADKKKSRKQSGISVISYSENRETITLE